MKKPKLKGKMMGMMGKGKKPMMKKKSPKKVMAKAMRGEDAGNTGVNKKKAKSRKNAESATF